MSLPVAPCAQCAPQASCNLQVHVPEGLTLLELDLIRLVAQFVARNGKNFLTGELRQQLLLGTW
jgi:hypothetical protein